MVDQTDRVISKIMELSLEMGDTKTFQDIAKQEEEELKILSFRLELEQKLRQLHLPIEREAAIFKGFDLSSMEGLEELEKKIKKEAQKIWDKEQMEHISRVEELKKEKKQRLEILAMQEESRKEKEAKLEEKKQMEKMKEKQHLIALKNLENNEKKKINQERNELYKEEYQRAKALMYVRTVKKQPIPMNSDGTGFSIDWKEAYNEYVQYKKNQKKNENEKINEIEEDYKARLQEHKLKNANRSEYIKQAFSEDNHEKYMKALEQKKPKNEGQGLPPPVPKTHEKSIFYKNIEKELGVDQLKLEKQKQEEKKMRIAHYMAKIRENQAPEISQAKRQEQLKRIEEIQQRENIHEMIEERRRKALENQKNYLAELRNENETHRPIQRRKSEKQKVEELEKTPVGNSRFPNYLAEIRSTPSLQKASRKSSRLEDRIKESERLDAEAAKRETLERINPMQFSEGTKGKRSDELFVKSIQAKLDALTKL